ncbi:MAG: hypothetical protein FWC00_03565 [Firmicutes bacterium]|nr:hypothetical protein [Bacillota bacterium]
MFNGIKNDEETREQKRVTLTADDFGEGRIKAAHEKWQKRLDEGKGLFGRKDGKHMTMTDAGITDRG